MRFTTIGYTGMSGHSGGRTGIGMLIAGGGVSGAAIAGTVGTMLWGLIQ